MSTARLQAAMLVAAATIAVTAAVAPANTGYPNIHAPTLYDTPAEFGGRFHMYIGNSDRATEVVACISSRCRRLQQDGDDNHYRALGSYFGLDLRAGQQRTMEISASNPGQGVHWGPAKITVE